MIKVLLVDDHDLVRKGIKRILDDVKDLTVVDQAKSGEEAVSICRRNAPDVVLMDVSMPGMGGLEATRQIMRMSENTRVIGLSMQKDHPIPAKVMQMGAFGFLTKDAEPSEVINAIYKVAAGQKYLSPEIAQLVAIGQLELTDTNPFDQLSDRELEITMMITRGQKVPDIADILNISAKTVNTYRYRMFEKLQVSSDVELTHLAIKHKLIQTDQF